MFLKQERTNRPQLCELQTTKNNQNSISAALLLLEKDIQSCVNSWTFTHPVIMHPICEYIRHNILSKNLTEIVQKTHKQLNSTSKEGTSGAPPALQFSSINSFLY